MSIETEAQLPKYEHLAGRIERMIREGAFPENSFLPSQAELMASEGVALSTVRQAMNVLTQRGLVRPEHGRGVRVRDWRRETRGQRKTRGLRRIGIVIAGPDPDDPAYMDVVNGVSEVVEPRGEGMLVFRADARPESPDLRRFMIRCDGIILMGVLSHAHLELARRSEVPFVIAGHAIESADEEANQSITLDVDAAAGLAVQSLIGFGHRHMAVCLQEISTTYQRGLIEAIQAKAGACGMACRSILTADLPGGIADMAATLGANGSPTAVVVQGRPMTRRLLAAAEHLGLQVPRDFSVISIGTAKQTPEEAPHATRIAFNVEELGRQCAQLLLNNRKTLVQRRLAPEFVPGETVGPVKK